MSHSENVADTSLSNYGFAPNVAEGGAVYQWHHNLQKSWQLT